MGISSRPYPSCYDTTHNLSSLVEHCFKKVDIVKESNIDRKYKSKLYPAILNPLTFQNTVANQRSQSLLQGRALGS